MHSRRAPHASDERRPAATDAAARAARQREAVVARCRRVLPAHALLWQREDTVPYECDGLTAYRELPLVVALPETEDQVAAVLQGLPRAGRAGGGARRRHRPVGRRAAARAGRDAVAGQVQPHPAGRPASRAPPSCSAACATSRSARPPRRYGLYYAPDPSQPDRLHDRRQRGRELRRRALPEVRPDPAQRAARARLHGRRRAGRASAARRSTRRGSTCCRWWSAARACWR